MKISLSLQQNFKSEHLLIKRSAVLKVVKTALIHLAIDEDCELGIALVDQEESQQLNFQYRGKDKPTNVLSFPSELPEQFLVQLEAKPLGDLVICIPIVLTEAKQQYKTAVNHFSHLLVHGVLHLLGYDHELGDTEAELMETLEIEILDKLGIANPYLEQP